MADMRSYLRRWSGSESTAYASLISINLFYRRAAGWAAVSHRGGGETCCWHTVLRATCRCVVQRRTTHLGIRVLAHVWMVPHREPLERPLDLLCVCLFPHPENLRFFCRGQFSTPIPPAWYKPRGEEQHKPSTWPHRNRGGNIWHPQHSSPSSRPPS